MLVLVVRRVQQAVRLVLALVQPGLRGQELLELLVLELRAPQARQEPSPRALRASSRRAWRVGRVPERVVQQAAQREHSPRLRASHRPQRPSAARSTCKRSWGLGAGVVAVSALAVRVVLPVPHPVRLVVLRAASLPLSRKPRPWEASKPSQRMSSSRAASARIALGSSTPSARSSALRAT